VRQLEERAPIPRLGLAPPVAGPRLLLPLPLLLLTLNCSSFLFLSLAETMAAAAATTTTTTGAVSRRAGAGATKVSVVVPTFREDGNVEALTRRVFRATRAAGLDAELIFVDDDSGESTLATERIVRRLSEEEGYNVRVHVRRRGHGRGLSSAVLLGLQKLATADYMLVMDADLQHEPESVPDVLAPVIEGRADFAVGSRHVAGGEARDFKLSRRVISAGATLLARPLTTCTDPMSGFFALPRSTLRRAERLNPMGYKIGLELMVRCDARRIVDVPIRFKDREAGESKLTLKQNALYLVHLANLYSFKWPVAVVVVALGAVAAAVFVLYAFWVWALR